ncbi:24300_t:CDS:1, partial [Racocetra persica]
LLHKNRYPLYTVSLSVFAQDVVEIANHPQQTNKTKKQKLQAKKENNSDILIENISSRFQKLENAMLNFDEQTKLNSIP